MNKQSYLNTLRGATLVIGILWCFSIGIFPTEENSHAEASLAHEILDPEVEGSEPSSQEQGLADLMAESPSGDESEGDKANIYLNFNDASLSSVVNYLAAERGLNLIQNKELNDVKVSLTSHEPFTLDDSWNILLTLLEASGFSYIDGQPESAESAQVGMIVKNDQSSRAILPLYFATDLDTLPDDDTQIRYIYLFSNIQAANVRSILTQMLAPNSVVIIPNLNAAIITEKSLNIKSAMRIVQELDLGGMRQSIQVIALEDASATYIVDLFNQKILPGGVKKQPTQRRIDLGQKTKSYDFFSYETKLIAEPRNNRIILLGNEKSNERIRRFIKKYLDVPVDAPESRLHIKELKYINAEKIAPLLERAIEPPIQDKKSPLYGKVKFFEDMLITAEESFEEGEEVNSTKISLGGGNRLLIASNNDDWHRIEPFIDMLDKPSPQVAIEILFVDIDVTDNTELGGQIRSKTPLGGLGMNFQNELLVGLGAGATPPGPGLEPELRNNMIQVPEAQVDAGVKATWFSFGKPSVDAEGNGTNEGGLWGVVKAALSVEKANVISQPFIVVMNRHTGNVSFTEKKWLPGEVETGVTAVRQEEPIEATTDVDFTPSINLYGDIELGIKINISEFIETATTLTAGPPRTVRNLTTRATVHDGEVLVIGGLMQSIISETIRETPFLGKIPIFGPLFFKDHIETEEIRNLYIFIRPTIIKPNFEGEQGDYTQLKLAYAKHAIKKSDRFNLSCDPIERWLFDTRKKPQCTLLTQYDANQLEYTIIDDFTEGKYQPISVQIQEDPYYKTKTSRTITKRRDLIKVERERLKKRRRTHVERLEG